jgi:predicted MFS family arabinose efflux permease
VIAALLAPRLLLESRSTSATRHFDAAGAVTITAGLSALVFALVDANSAGWASAQTIGLLAVAIGLIAGFVVIERRSAAPLVPFGIFRSRTLTGANVTGLLTGAALLSMFFFISLYMQQVLHYSPLKTGFAYLPLSAAIIISAGIASQLVTRLGFKPVLLTGQAFVVAGLVWFGQVSVGGGFTSDVLGPSLLAAVGLGFTFVPVTIASVSGVSERDSGLASGLINTAQQVGGALGLAILAAIANARTSHVMAGGAGGPVVALNDGFRIAFLAGAGFAVLGIIAALTLIRSADSRGVAAAEPLPATP